MSELDGREQLRLRVEAVLKRPVKNRRIRAIRVNSAQQWQPPLTIEVGSACANLEQGGPAETILAIFESSVFVVVTPEHDGIAKPVYLFAREDVKRVVEMD